MANPAIVKAQTIDAAWTQLATAVDFGGVDRETGFEVSIQNAIDAEAALAESRAAVVDKQGDRDAKVQILQAQTNLVVNGVKGDAAYGDDSDLYEAMGFVPKSKRKSGLTQKTPPAPAP